jgi:hypothetical protein
MWVREEEVKKSINEGVPDSRQRIVVVWHGYLNKLFDLGGEAIEIVCGASCWQMAFDANFSLPLPPLPPLASSSLPLSLSPPLPPPFQFVSTPHPFNPLSSLDNENILFMKGLKLSKNIRATNDMSEALAGTEIVMVVIPTPFLRATMIKHRDELPTDTPLVCCTKGIENGTLQTPYEILVEELPGKYHGQLAAVSGPSFAKEVVNGTPTSVLCASHHEAVSKKVQHAMSDKAFRVYTGDDLIGAELCGTKLSHIFILFVHFWERVENKTNS